MTASPGWPPRSWPELIAEAMIAAGRPLGRGEGSAVRWLDHDHLELRIGGEAIAVVTRAEIVRRTLARLASPRERIQ